MRFRHRFLQLYGLLAFAFSQPLFELLRQNTAFLSVHDLDRLDLFLLVAAISLVPALAVLVLLLCSSALGARASTAVFVMLAAVSAFGILWMAVKDLTELTFGVRVAVPAAFGFLAAWLVVRWDFAGYLGRMLAVAGIVFPALFLLDARVATLYTEPHVTAASSSLERRPPVILVVLDELPLASLLTSDETINSFRYPHFAKLANTSTWFRNASSVADGTIYGIPAILTGRRPKTRGVPTRGLYPENLFTWLRNDYRITAVEWATRLCPEGACTEIVRRETRSERWASTVSDLRIILPHLYAAPEHRDSLEALSNRWRDFGRSGLESHRDGPEETVVDEPAADEFIRLTASIDDRDAALYFLHARLPHVPWQYLPSGTYYGPAPAYPPGIRSDEVWNGSELLAVQGFQRHLLQLQFTDRLLGRLMERLRKAGVWDGALFILVADHGASFLPNVSRRHVNHVNFPAILSVPFFVKTPGQKTGRIDDRVVETIDLLPTIADVLGSSPPWELEGRSLLDPAYPGRSQRLVVADPPFRLETYPAQLSLTPILRRKLALFGTGEDKGSIFRAGPVAHLVGKSVDQFPRGKPSGIQAKLNDSTLYQTINRNSERIPALISGYVQGMPEDGRLRLAFAVNGRIWSVTETFNQQGGVASFAAVVPEDAFLSGRNDVRVFMVSSERSVLQLTPLSVGTPQWTLDETNGQTEIVSEGGKRIPVRGHELAGRLDQVLYDREWTEFLGWAADLSDGQAVQIALFVNGDAQYFTSSRLQRQDVARFFERDDLLTSGFHLKAPTRALTEHDPVLRLIAVRGERAVELRYPDDTKGLRFDKSN